VANFATRHILFRDGRIVSDNTREVVEA